MSNKVTLPRWVWWKQGTCVVEVLQRGHYPDTVLVRLPDDTKTEVYQSELETHDASSKSV